MLTAFYCTDAVLMVNVTDVCVGGADILKHVLSGNGTRLPTLHCVVSLM